MTGARAARVSPAPRAARAAVDVERYLRRLGVERPAAPDAEALARLHEAHLLAIPFENLSIAWGEPISLDEGEHFRKIVERGRGGGCFELNALFAWALRAVGYEVELLSARVRRDDGGFGPPFDHMCLRVRADERPWLADVGFGDSFRRPLPLDRGEVHEEGRTAYALRPAGGELDLVRREGDGPWAPQYRLDPRPRRLDEFAPMSCFHQTEGPFTKRCVCTLATAWGRITLTDRALVRTTFDGVRTEEPVEDEAAWGAALRAHFGMARGARGTA
ncbi:MAG TPA: arylamine N-acetyltransferase [Anaeromyxobacter sp.]